MKEKLKRIIFRKLYEDLSHVQIIEHDDSVWFIDADKKYWYLEYRNDGVLYWRHSFFNKFFELFSMEIEEFEPFIGEWCEEVLNCKVIMTDTFEQQTWEVKEVLDSKVVPLARLHQVSEVIECKAFTPTMFENGGVKVIENVLNHKVDMMLPGKYSQDDEMEQVLEVVKTIGREYNGNHKVNKMLPGDYMTDGEADQVLESKVIKTIGGEYNGNYKVEQVLNHEKSV